MDVKTEFFAYPSKPDVIGQTIEDAVGLVKRSADSISIDTWRSIDIAGHFISEEVTSAIENSDIVIADISVLNFNVAYEVGYAIGQSKRILLTRNKSLSEQYPSIREVGIFDTLGYSEYENSECLVSLLRDAASLKAVDVPQRINKRAPVYLIDTKHKTDWATRIVSRIKKAKYIFRTFDPNELPRLSAYDAIDNVAQSYGVVVPLLANTIEDSAVHNLRCAFVAGLATGMNKALCIIQDGFDPVPLDYRDFVNVTRHPNDIDEYIGEFAGRVAECFQQDTIISTPKPETFLQSLDLGASSAENEMRTLESYYLKTDQYLKSLRGEAHLVIGRKGSGKSAIFLQVRDKERSNKKNIVLDLKPDGYKLIKFKELMLRFLAEGAFQHTIMAFWEYVLLLEIAYKLLEKDKEVHLRDHIIYEQYVEMSSLYKADGYATEGDFSERMSGLIGRIASEYSARYGHDEGTRLSGSELTELLYLHDIRSLERHIISYMKHKDALWLLFDNLDKGWPTSGLQHEDLLIIRALIDATRKIEREFSKHDIEAHTILFLRNDVYELLVRDTSDRGKEASVLLDWIDSDLLRELVRLRIVRNGLSDDAAFADVWLKICVSHYNGEESFQYLIDRSLMRPRFLLNLINHCKSFAINLNHSRIEAEDIEKGLRAFSTDLLTDIGYEIKDVAPEADDVLLAFIESTSRIGESGIRSKLEEFGIESMHVDKIFALLLWHGFLGLELPGSDTKYIYDFNYHMRLLKGFQKKHKGRLLYTINPAFWPALMINDR